MDDLWLFSCILALVKVHESLVSGKSILWIEGGAGQATRPSMPEGDGFHRKYADKQANLTDGADEQQKYREKKRGNCTGRDAALESAHWIQSIAPPSTEPFVPHS